MIEELCEELADLGGGKILAGREGPEGPHTVGVEARLVRHAVSNLIVNALRYARSRVEVTVERGGQMIRINVDDDGPGVPAAEREWIFEPFHRRDDERTRSTRGFGLGLAIVRRIAEAHDGSVAALSSDLGGARFRLSFPRWT